MTKKSKGAEFLTLPSGKRLNTTYVEAIIPQGDLVNVYFASGLMLTFQPQDVPMLQGQAPKMDVLGWGKEYAARQRQEPAQHKVKPAPEPEPEDDTPVVEYRRKVPDAVPTEIRAWRASRKSDEPLLMIVGGKDGTPAPAFQMDTKGMWLAQTDEEGGLTGPYAEGVTIYSKEAWIAKFAGADVEEEG